MMKSFMRFSSIDYLAAGARRAFLRFPFTILSSFFASCLGVYWVEYGIESQNPLPCINLILCLLLGIALYFCASVYAIKNNYTRGIAFLPDAVVTALLVLIYFTLPNSNATHNPATPYIRFAVYAIAGHLLVSFIAFLSEGNLNGFWNFNKTLFIRFLTTGLYSACLCGGIYLAMAAIYLLFHVSIHEELFGDVAFVIGCFFNTWFFVSGVPADFEHLNEETNYPKGLKIFSQYVLLPLLLIYLVILYAYGMKILWQWNWPNGIVSYLIFFVSVLGILTILLIYPFAHEKGNDWIKKTSRIFYFILLPLVALLFIAIGMRIADYGVTIHRYVIVMVGVWLSIVCIYFSIGGKNIKLIPVSLTVILLPALFGPWGMFNISEKSQVERLKSILEKAGIVKGGKIQNEVIWKTDSARAFFEKQNKVNEDKLNDSLRGEVHSIMRYLEEHHGFSKIQPLYRQNMDSVIVFAMRERVRERDHYDEKEVYLVAMGLKRHNFQRGDYTFSSDLPNAINTKNYDYLIWIGDDWHEDSKSLEISSFTINDEMYELLHSSKVSDSIALKHNQITVASLPVDPLINPLLKTFGKTSYCKVPASMMRLEQSNEQVDIKIELSLISLRENGGSLRIASLHGHLFLKLKK